IGYVEYGYALQTNMPMATLENKAGKFVKADLKSEETSLSSVALPPDLRAWIPDPTGDGAYPIVTYTWLLCYKKYDDLQGAKVGDRVRPHQGPILRRGARLHPLAAQRRRHRAEGG